MEPLTESEKKKEPLAAFMSRRFWVMALAVICIAALFFFYELRAPGGQKPDSSIFTIQSGASLKGVGTDLESMRYIRSRAVFATIVTFFGSEHHISPGDYYFRPGESVLGIARQVAFGVHDIVPTKITIPEGENVTEMAALIAQKIPGFPSADFISQAKGSEGYLFPETYFVYPTVTVPDLISQMTAMFTRQTSGLFTPAALGTRTESQIVIMASLIEREAHGDDDRAIIAGILWKRFDEGIPLEVDSTVAFANSIPDSALTKSDFSIDSPYNTYLYKGLPPAPIANPGLQALEASLKPAQTDYLYYLHDNNGTIHYAKTYAEHLTNIKKYLD